MSREPMPSCAPCSSFHSPAGLHVRVIECANGLGLPGGSTKYGTYENFHDTDDCIADQMSTREFLSTSVLRADLPLAVFSGNRAFGFVLKPPVHGQFGCAYPQDAWTGRSNLRPQCSPANADALTRARMMRDLYREQCKRHNNAFLAQKARAHHRVLSCCHTSVSSALEEQRSFVALTRNESECVSQRHVNNQVSRAWRLSDVVGVFYVASEMRHRAEVTLRKLRALRGSGHLALSLIYLTPDWKATMDDDSAFGNCSCVSPRMPPASTDAAEQPALAALQHAGTPDETPAVACGCTWMTHARCSQRRNDGTTCWNDCCTHWRLSQNGSVPLS